MDNSTPIKAKEFDQKIENTIPLYSKFHQQTIELVKSLNIEYGHWLDTGCGTGLFIKSVLKEFKDMKFSLYDPAKAMIIKTKENLKDEEQSMSIKQIGSQDISLTNTFDIITAIQSHHYLKDFERRIAIQNCYQALKNDGCFIFFENFAPNCETSKTIALKRWGEYQREHGKSNQEVEKHLQRYNTHYFPITLEEHFKLLYDTGFKVVEIFWLSYMQVGIYAIK